MSITFGRWLKNRRRSLGLTQSALGKRIGCAAITVRKIEADELRPSRQVAELMALDLNVPSDERDSFVAWARGEIAARTPLLPVPPTPLFGRDEVSADLTTLLRDPAVRLVTLLGPPGVGKTRLALHVAASVSEFFSDGVAYVSLASLADPTLVLTTIGQALGLRETADQSLYALLVERLRSRKTLLVLDTFEQVIAAAPEIARLLASAQSLTLLVTSRAVLHITGEREYQLPPFVLPDGDGTSHSAIAELPAVKLFVERARAVRPDFRLSEKNAAAVVSICRQLDGLPLAIELAAARCKLFEPQQLLARLADGGVLTLLTNGLHDWPAHHRTLRAAIDWSYGLLDPDEQNLFTLLALFAGGCTLETLTQFGAENGHVDASLLLDRVAALIDQCMVQQAVTEGEPRFLLLDTLRGYALDVLRKQGQLVYLQRRYALYYVDLIGSTIHSSLEHLKLEQGNIRAALAWCCSSEGDAELGLRLAGALGSFWFAVGSFSEGRSWLQRTLEHAEGVSDVAPAVRARALSEAGHLAWFQSDCVAAEVYLQQSLSLWREQNDSTGQGWTLLGLGRIACLRGEYERAESLLHDSRDQFSSVDDPCGSGWAVNALAQVKLARGAYADAVEQARAQYAQFRILSDDEGCADARWTEGNGLIGLSRLDAAQACFEEAHRLSVKRGERLGIGGALLGLGLVAFAQGHEQRAAQLLEESLAIHRELGHRWSIAHTLTALALALSSVDAQRAASLLNEADALYSALGMRRSALEQAVRCRLTLVG